MKPNAQPSSLDYYHYLTNKSWFRRMVRKFFLKDIARHLTGKVLDVGCGAGELLAVCPKSIGSDLNPLLATYCHNSGYPAIVADCTALPFASNSFDSLVMSNLLEHLEDPHKAVEEASRVLRDGGVSVITVPFEAGFRSDPTHVTKVEENQLEAFGRQTGLAVEKLYSFPFGGRCFGKFLYFFELRAVLRKQPNSQKT